MQNSILTLKIKLVLAMLFLTMVVGGSVPSVSDSRGKAGRPPTPRGIDMVPGAPAPAPGVPAPAPGAPAMKMPDPAPPVAAPVPIASLNNKGVEFVLGFEANNTTGGTQTIFITGDVATSGMVEIPGLNQPWSVPFTVTPGAITSVNVPMAAQVTSSDAIEAKGIRVTASNEIVVYGSNQETLTTDAFLGLPTDIMGIEHIILSYGAGLSTPSQFMIVGIVGGTKVTITPSVAVGNRRAGVPYTIGLNRLETYQLQTNASNPGADLSGTIITSDQSVSVFGGVQCADVPVGVPSCDHLVEQLPGTSTWGTHFLTAPLANRTGGDMFRIVVSNNATSVTIDGGAPIVLNRGAFHEWDLASGSSHEIMTNGPAMVMQYSKGGASDASNMDPFMMMIPPTEQFVDAYTVATPAATPVSFSNYINLVVATGDLATCTVDGNLLSAVSTTIGTSGFSAVQQSVGIGSHSLSCATPFGAYSYGWSPSDSYGYPGGLALAPTGDFPMSMITKRVKAKTRPDRVGLDFIAMWGSFSLSQNDPNTVAVEPTSDGIKLTVIPGTGGLRVIDEPITVSYFNGALKETIAPGLLKEDPILRDVYFLEAFPQGTVDEFSISLNTPGVGKFKLGFGGIELDRDALNASDPNGDNMPVALGFVIGNDAGRMSMGYHITVNDPAKSIIWEGQ